MNDTQLLTSMLISGLHFLRSHWRMLGRPTVTLCLQHFELGSNSFISLPVFVFVVAALTLTRFILSLGFNFTKLFF